ncbi:efflux RND transporter periplasmic adaptor subunit [Thermaurantiacus sp.]
MILIPVLALLAGLAWWQFGRKTSSGDRYQTSEVVRGDLVEVISANGTLNPVTLVNVGVQVSGTVEKIHADFNDEVKEGQILLELDPRLFRARLAQSEANLANQRAQAALAEANRKRSEALLARNFISELAYEQAVATAESTRAQVAAAEAAVAQDRANLAFSVVRSPVDGIVISRQVDIGQTVAASFQTPTLFIIARDLTKMQIEAAVAESDIGRVQLGQPVTFTVDAFGQRQFEGVVSQIRLNPSTQQNVVTFTVIIAVDNPDGKLLPGMTATASFKVRDLKNALLIPNAAMSFRPADWDPRAQREARRAGGGGRDRDSRQEEGFPATIFVLNGEGKPEPRRVRILASDDDRSAIAPGPVREGEKVITADNEAKPRAAGFGGGRPGGGGGRPGGGGGGGGG